MLTISFVILKKYHVFSDHCSGFQCRDGKCLSSSGRCNMLGECSNSEDEMNCTCADFLKAQLLHQKICDGVADCWDYSDETDCGTYRSFINKYKLRILQNANFCSQSGSRDTYMID